MAAAFDSTTDRLTDSAGFDVPTLGTVSFWCRPTWAYNDGAWHGFFTMRNGGATQFFDFFKEGTGSNMYLHIGGTLGQYVKSASGLVQNAWNHIILTWNDTTNTTEVFINGTSLTTSTTAFSLGSLAGNTFCMGNWASGIGFDQNFGGRMAEFAMWSGVVLDAGEIRTLSKGFSPLLVRPTSLFRFIPLIRDFKEYRTGASISNSGVSVEDHCPVILRKRKAG